MPKYILQPFFLIILVFLTSCASVSKVQLKANNFIGTRQFEHALKILDDEADQYGKKNALLYLLDKGMVLHYAGRYEESIVNFKRAKHKYDELYTQSLSRMAGSFLWNDYALPYRGEDFERVLINIFQALNYLMLDKPEEALVEARDVDSILSAINAQYSSDQKNVYQEDAFARFLMGILYEQGGRSSQLNDAFISYQKAFEIYENNYFDFYAFRSPQLLKENLLAASAVIDQATNRKYRNKLSTTRYRSLSEKKQLSEVIIFHYLGSSPIKVEASLILPLPDQYFSRFAFPRYQKKHYSQKDNYFIAKSKTGKVSKVIMQLGQDIESIAIKNLEDRKIRLMAKSITRSAGKYFVIKKQVESIEKKNGKTIGRLAYIASNLYTVYSERADLRSWQTLPAQIHIARLLLEPGEYDLFFNKTFLDTVNLQAGEKKFFIVK